MTQLLGARMLRALLFVQTLNEQNIEPSVSDADAFLGARTANDYDPITEGYFRSTVSYLLDARLLQSRGSTRILKLTKIGAALLSSANNDDSSKVETVPVEVVGRMTDPFVYAELLAHIDDVGDSMVIDPYLNPADLLVLLKLSGTRRFLTLDRGAAGLQKQKRKDQLQIAIGARPDLELRFAASKDSKELHDRLVIPQKGGEALTFGTSLGGTQLTVVTRLGAGTTNALREHYAPVWENGIPVEPIHRDHSE